MMKKFKISFMIANVLIVCAFLSQRHCSAQQDGDDIVIGKYKVLHSDILGENRLLYIHLPKDYENTQLSYPVLYLLYVDIYNYFADAAITAEKLAGTGEMPPVIIVGVENTNRYRDLLPIRTRDRAEGGGADNFLRFLENELIPYVDRAYKTKNFRILAGPQAAAVFSLYALFSRPDLFNAIISENPFMNPENADSLYPRAEQFFKSKDRFKSFLYIKCEQNERPRELEYARNLSKLLESEKPEGFRFKLDVTEPTGYFITPMPFAEAFRLLFAGHKLPDNFQTDSLQDILDYYKKLSGEYNFTVDPPDLMLTFEGDKLRRQGKATASIDIFNYQRKLYPRSLNALWQLGETYWVLGDFKKARDCYDNFLKIRDIDADMIRRRLSQIAKIMDSSAVYRIEQEIRANGIQAGLRKYQLIRSDIKNNLYLDENEFNALGYRLMGTGKTSDAIEIFKLNVELFPESFNVYDSLAEAYMNAGDNKNAIINYRKSLEINPDNNNARERLRSLEDH